MKTTKLNKLYSIMVLCFMCLAMNENVFANSIKNGGSLYRQFCTQCHGLKGDGRGVRARNEVLQPPPRDHTNGYYMNLQPTSRFFNVIKYGGKLNQLSHIMPQWKHIMSDEQIIDIIHYIRTLAVPAWKPSDSKTWGRNAFITQERIEIKEEANDRAKNGNN